LPGAADSLVLSVLAKLGAHTCQLGGVTNLNGHPEINNIRYF
jgi:hypothetical protein